MSLKVEDYKSWAEIFAPSRKLSKRARYRYKCSSTGLEPQHSPSKLNFVREDITTADGITASFGGQAHINGIKNHYDVNKNTPYEIGDPLIEPPWDGLPRDLTGLSVTEIVDTLWPPTSPNGWLLGTRELFDEHPFTTQAKTIEYFNYRVLAHFLFLCGSNVAVANPRESHLRAHWSMEYFLKTWGLATVDPAAPPHGPCPPLPACNEQDPTKTMTPNCVLPLGDWIVADIPEPSDTKGWFTHLQDALKQIVLRNDGSFEKILNATQCVGFSFIRRNSTLTFRVFITVI